MTIAYKALIAAAGLAPSGDNTQPWRFAIDHEAGAIALLLDPARDPSPMNAGQRMARIAVGAALENLVRVACGRGLTVELEGSAPPPALALVRLSGREDAPSEIERIVAARVTNRRPYDGHPLPDEELDLLVSATPPVGGTRTCWISDHTRLQALARLIGQADGLMFGAARMRQSFLAKVRFDAPASAQVDEGLNLDSLELSAADRFALRLMKRLPQWMFEAGGMHRVFAAKARTLVTSSSGLCLVVVDGDTAASDLAVGRAMQRAWLALTTRGLAAQPMMSLLVLENVLEHGDPALVERLGRNRLDHLRSELRAATPEIGSGRPAFLLRFGHAAAPSGRTGRLPLSRVLAASMSMAAAHSHHGQ